MTLAVADAIARLDDQSAINQYTRIDVLQACAALHPYLLRSANNEIVKKRVGGFNPVLETGPLHGVHSSRSKLIVVSKHC